jgi:hypothetical protein
MYIISAPFDSELAYAKASELLALGDSPERLAERLDTARELEVIKQGAAKASFEQLLQDLARLKQFIEIEKQIEDVKNDQSMLRFLGSKFKEVQIAKLEEERRKFGSLIEAPRWFYKQPRVRLLSAIRDYALDGSQQGDAAWIEVDEKKLFFPLAEMFEKADITFAKTVQAELEKPLKNVDPRFLLEKFEGNRSIAFDFQAGVATYYVPTPASG